MGASVTLVTSAVAVQPGAEVAVEVKVRNTGTVVDEFSLDVLGDSAGWAAVEPPVLSLFPGAEGVARVVFRPPRLATTPAGLLPFGVRARSREDAAGSAVEEGTVDVAPFLEPFAELVPRTSRGSSSGTHDLAIDNRGNTRLSAELQATDADRLLKFDLKPPAVVVEPGMAGFAKIRVSPTKRFWRGTPKTRPFQLFVHPEGGTPIQLDGTLLQESVLPPWFLKALLALVGLLILLVIFWLFILKPSIETAASEAVASPIAELKDGVNDALAAGGLPTIGPDGGGGAPTEAPEPTASAPTPSGEPTPAPPTATPGVIIPGLGAPVDGRLDADNTSLPVTGTLFLTDVVFSNPTGQEGAIVLLRDSTPLFELQLQNFRDLDFHFVTPIVVADGQTLQLSLACTGEAASPCNPAVFYSGYQRP